jgi:hypothetical protein
MAEYPPAFQSKGRNGVVIAAIWLLGVAALLEIILAGIALAPRILTAVRNTNQPADSVSKPALSDSTPTPSAVEISSGQTPSQSASETNVNEVQPALPLDTPAGTSDSNQDSKLDGAEDGPKKLVIAIKAPPDASIDVPQVKVQVFFYDTDGGEITPSKAQVTSNWLSLPVTWKKHGEPELLEVDYKPDFGDPDIKFAGYVVAIYYKGEIQDFRADPLRLTKLFPLKYFIGTDEP